MAQFKQMSEEESLKRSHSKFSNFKLTLVCLLCALSSVVLVASLATIGTDIIGKTILTAVIIASAALTLSSLLLISAFKR